MPSVPSAKLPEDSLQNAGAAESADVWIYSTFQKDGWVPRKRGDQIRPDHPGCAIRLGEDLFEIVTVEETREPGYAVRYGLKKWQPQHAVGKIIAYTRETQAKSAGDYLEEQHRRQLRQRILWLLPVAGLAPAPLQREWEKKTALNMTVVSAVSAVTTASLFIILIKTFGGFS